MKQGVSFHTMDMHEFSTALKQDENGIWHASEAQSVSYPVRGNDNCFPIEEESFWFNHRNDCIISVVKNFPPLERKVVFDIGGGNGFVSSALSKAGFEMILVEPGRSGAANAKKRGVENIICATMEAACFKARSLPAIGLFDVIEHVKDDRAFLRSMHALLNKEGMLYVTVPAFSFLWSREDILAGHFRRYDLKGISALIKASGFEMVFSSYMFWFLPAPVFLFRTLPYKMGFSGKDSSSSQMEGEHAVKRGIISSMVKTLLQPELRAIERKIPVRFGGSCLIAAKRL